MKNNADFKPAGVRKAVAAFCALAAMTAVTAPLAHAAKSDGCAGGGFVISGLLNGQVIQSGATATIAANNVGPSFQILGKYIEFTVVSNTFGIENYTFTGATGPEDITGGRRTVAFQSKTPDHKGATLTGAITVTNEDGDIVVSRKGTGISMKIQAKDCAQGGIFQMEPQRTDKTTTRIVHTLGPGVFYYDNPNFRAREGDIVPFKDTTLPVPSRINIGNNLAAKFVSRDSLQVATRVNEPACTNNIAKRDGTIAVVQHCGQRAIYDVSSGGRMGYVTGEDSTEVAPSPTVCTHKCQAQNRVRGRATNLGAPFPVPEASRLKPAAP